MYNISKRNFISRTFSTDTSQQKIFSCINFIFKTQKLTNVKSISKIYDKNKWEGHQCVILFYVISFSLETWHTKLLLLRHYCWSSASIWLSTNMSNNCPRTKNHQQLSHKYNHVAVATTTTSTTAKITQVNDNDCYDMSNNLMLLLFWFV